MRAGYGRAELTPPLGTELVGYGYYLRRRSERVADPLYARAVYLEDGETRYVIVSCDLLGLSREVAQKVRAGMAALGLPPDQLILVSIHTHTGPGTIYHEGCGEVSPEYAQTVPGRILEAIREAVADADEVTGLFRGMEDIPEGLIYNRSNKEGFLDRSVRAIRITRREKPELLLASLGCHAVCSGVSADISADFPGAFVREAERTGCRAVFLNGLCGDVDPVRENTSGERLRETLGRAVFAHAGTSYAMPLTLRCGQIGHTLRLTKVDREAIRLSADQAVERAGGEGAGAARVARLWEQDMLARLDHLAFTEDIRIPFLLLGDTLLIALTVEGFGKIGDIVRKCLGRPDTMVLGCAEQLLGYLPTEDDMRRGAYAALESTYLYRRLPYAPGEAERLGAAIGDGLEAWIEEDEMDESAHGISGK